MNEEQAKKAREFLHAMHDEYIVARSKFEPLHSSHEGFAVMLEEVDEVWEAIKSKGVPYSHLYDECVQVATMAMALAIECENTQHGHTTV